MVTRLARPIAVLVAVLSVAAITGFVLMALSASAASGSGGKGGKGGGTSTISIQSTASLTTSQKGGFPGADVTIKYSCFPAPSGGYGAKGGYSSSFGSVTIGDLNGNGGSAFFQPTCNDVKNTAVLFVPGNFSAGGAAANAVVCGFDCAFVSKEIKLS